MPTNYDTETIKITLLYGVNTMRNVSVGRLNNYEIKYKFCISTVTTYAYFKWSLVNIYHSKQ